MSTASRQLATQIFLEALAAVDVRHVTQQHIVLTADTLSLAGRSIPRSSFDRVVLLAMGKAAMPMYQAAAESLTPLRVEALVVAPEEHKAEVQGQFLPGSHPIPTQHSIRAAEAALALLQTADARTVVLFLISGGASAMMEMPLDASLTLADIQHINTALVGSGLPIAKINCIRKHLSAIKGGRLALAAQHALAQVSLLISDVPWSDPSVIASGPTLPDTFTLADAQRIAANAPIEAETKSLIVAHLQQETPKPDHSAFAHTTSKVILSSEHLASAAIEAAARHGYLPIYDEVPDDRPVEETADRILGRIPYEAPKSALISVGEVTVALPPIPGTGGRNQHLALTLAQSIPANATFLSAGSDGIDGNSLNAGAVVDSTTLERATKRGAAEALAGFNTAPLFQSLQDAITTGPTGNNLRDLRILLLD